jgi:hypothetical protein
MGDVNAYHQDISPTYEDNVGSFRVPKYLYKAWAPRFSIGCEFSEKIVNNNRKWCFVLLLS